MHRKREDKDQGLDFLNITILPDGEVVLSGREDASLDLALVLGDESARRFCEQSSEIDVVVGKPMCG